MRFGSNESDLYGIETSAIQPSSSMVTAEYQIPSHALRVTSPSMSIAPEPRGPEREEIARPLRGVWVDRDGDGIVAARRAVASHLGRGSDQRIVVAPDRRYRCSSSQDAYLCLLRGLGAGRIDWVKSPKAGMLPDFIGKSAVDDRGDIGPLYGVASGL